MQVAPSCGQFFNSCKWRHLVAKFGTNASGATISWRDNSSLGAIPWVRCASGNVLLSHNTLYQNLKRYRACQIICCKATSLCEIMSREDKMTILSKRALKRIFIAPNTPWILHKTLLIPQYGNIYPEIYLTTKETHFCQMSREDKMGKSINVTV